MSFEADLRRVAVEHAEDIDSTLEEARRAQQRLRMDAQALERRIVALEFLNELVGEGATAPSPSSLTLHEAMVLVLEGAPSRRLRAGDLAAEINGRRLYRMRDGRPVENQQIHARVGNYGHLFRKEGPFICLVDDDPAVDS